MLLTHAFNHYYTVASPKTFDAYRTSTGLAIVRHYALNENMMGDKQGKSLLGYFVADVERAGPYCMMAEVGAMANGDPTMIGYLVGSNFGRGFPKYAIEFNANFLALPALSSRIVKHACDDHEVIVRRIDTESHGTRVAVINTSLHAKQDLAIVMPEGQVTDAVTGRSIERADSKIRLTVHPCQLRSFRIVEP